MFLQSTNQQKYWYNSECNTMYLCELRVCCVKQNNQTKTKANYWGYDTGIPIYAPYGLFITLFQKVI